MIPDPDLEAQIAEETGHDMDCFDWWMETALNAGVDAVEIYALWYQEAGNGFANQRYGRCTCGEE